MWKNYLDEIVKKKQNGTILSYEDRLFVRKYIDRVEGLKSEERGMVFSFVDAVMAERMIKNEHLSVMDVAKYFDLPGRVSAYILLGLKNPLPQGAYVDEKSKKLESPKKQFRPTKAVAQEIVRLYEAGTPTHTIASKFAVNQAAIRYVLKKYGKELDRNHKRLPHLSKNEVDAILKYHFKEYTPEKIASTLRIDAGQVSRCIQRMTKK